MALQFDAATFDWGMAKCHNLLNKCLGQTQRPPTSGKILAHSKEQAANMIEEVGASLCIFKIGVSANPLLRYASYLEMGYQQMRIIHTSPSLDSIHMLEAALISMFQDYPGCKNSPGSGGEGGLNRHKPVKPPFFVYIVGGRADKSDWYL